MDHKQVSHLEALERERVGYVDRGLWKRVRDVDVQICLARDLWWEKPNPPAEAVAATIPRLERPYTHLMKAAETIAEMEGRTAQSPPDDL